MRKSFIYRTLIKALPVQNIEVLFKRRFFIQEYKYLSSIHIHPSHTHEGGQIIQNSIGQFRSTNSFLLICFDRSLVLFYLGESNELEIVLFEISADPQLN